MRNLVFKGQYCQIEKLNLIEKRGRSILGGKKKPPASSSWRETHTHTLKFMARLIKSGFA
jgi:hypothetical protein